MVLRLLVTTIVIVFSRAAAAETVAPMTATYHSEIEKISAGDAPARRVMDWEFRRSNDFVAIVSPSEQREERWVHDSAGRLWYSRLFHAERKVIEYQPVDLSLGGISNSWTQIRSVIDPKQLEALNLTSESHEAAGHRASVYRGSADGVEIEVWWIEDLEIPAFVSKRARDISSTLRLLKVSDTKAAPQPALPEGYEVMDFSDLGDRHHDPFVERLMKYDGLWFGH